MNFVPNFFIKLNNYLFGLIREYGDFMNKNDKRKVIVGVCFIVLCVFCLFLVNKNANKTVDSNDSAVVEEEDAEIISKEDIACIEEYDEYSVYSSSFKGVIKFDSNLIDLPFVQSVDNDFYLRRDWITNEYSELGSVFMDYECDLDSKNIILYGHFVYSSLEVLDDDGNKLDNSKLMFTPLTKLIDEKNYEDNKYVSLILEDEVRTYEIVSVFYCNLVGEGEDLYPEEYLEYYLTEYSDDYFKEYKKKIKNVEFYDTGVDFTNEDNLLTLQTCVENNDKAREIVLCKEVSSRKLDRAAYEEYLSSLSSDND